MTGYDKIPKDAKGVRIPDVGLSGTEWLLGHRSRWAFPRLSDREPTGWARSCTVGSIKSAVRKAQPLLGVILPGW